MENDKIESAARRGRQPDRRGRGGGPSRSSVVKELMENAVDAGSTVVTVNYRDGGKSLIQVVDNGCGMSDTDARLAFERHATSKIRSADDLYRLHSFGFRGEALPSIASVAEVELRTRTPYGELGTKVCIHGGRFQSQEPVQMPQGTQFSVKNLYNTPARRRFLKEASVEARHIRVQRVALCNPGIAFTLCDGDAPLVQLPATNLRQRIVSAVGGREIAKNLLEVSVDTSMVRVECVGRPSAAKKTNREQFLFVNGRYFPVALFPQGRPAGLRQADSVRYAAVLFSLYHDRSRADRRERAPAENRDPFRRRAGFVADIQCRRPRGAGRDGRRAADGFRDRSVDRHTGRAQGG